jgi:DNA-binding NarL/FixJ family response regulator
MHEAKALRLAVVEDDPRYRASLVALLHTLETVKSVAAYSAAGPLLAAAERAQRLGDEPPWDLVLMDLGLPAIPGAEATRRLKAMFPGVLAIALTVFEDPASVLEAICAGVDGYIVKEASLEELEQLLALTVANGAVLSPRLAGTLLKLVRKQGAAGGPSATPTGAVRLAQRQYDVLRSLAEGRSYREIAEELGVSLDTVRTHVRRIYAALQVHSAAQAVSQAVNRGLL